MLRPVRAGLALMLIAAFTVIGCGGTVIDAGKAESAISDRFKQDLNVETKSVGCPGDVNVDPGTTFECDVETVDGTKGSVKLKILNDNADVNIISTDITK